MIGNGICDIGCLNEDCDFDRSDCECAENCWLGMYWYDYCSDECMDLRCNQYQDLLSCTDITKKKQNYYIQMLSQNFNARFSLEACFNSDPSCSENDLTYDRSSSWSYYGQCQTVECTYFLPYYNSNTNCSDECSVCIDSSTCLECNPTKFQYFTECVDSCPAGYEPISILFLSQQVCIGKIYLEVRDKSAYSYPSKIYVNASAISEGPGDINSPFKSLSLAFHYIWSQATVFILFEGTYDLDLLDPSETMPFFIPSSPLKRISGNGKNSSFKYISIQAAACQDYGEEEGCEKSRPIIRPSKLVQIYLNADIFEITGVDFDGSDLVCNNIRLNCPCSIPVCKYCANLLNISGRFYTDQFESVYFKHLGYFPENPCSVFDGFLFLESIEESTIFLKDVEFRNFGMGSESLLTVSNSSLIMRNVNFYNIVPGRSAYEAVISINNRELTSYDIKYEVGKVLLLNDGYELDHNTNLAGFLIAKYVEELIITEVIFEFNISYHGLDNAEVFGPMIYAINPSIKVKISDTVFKNNFVYSGLIYIESEGVQLTIEASFLSFYALCDIILQNIQIYNTSCKNHCIYCTNSSPSSQNILISGITIKDSVSITESMIKFDKSALGWVESSEKLKSFEIRGLYAENTFFSGSLIELENIANVKLSNIIIKNSGDFDEDLYENIVNEITFYEFIMNDYYIKIGYREFYNILCDGIISIQSCYKFSWIDGEFSNNNCKNSDGNSNIIISSTPGDLIISNVKFSDIHASSIYSNAIYISEHYDSLITISNCIFSNITNSKGTGVVRIIGSYNVRFYNNTLTDISGSTHGAIFIESSKLYIKDCEFDNIESKNDNGGAIAYYGNDFLNYNELVIEDSSFNRCKTPKAYGCIAIDKNSLSIDLKLAIRDLRFTSSEGESAAIYIQKYVTFSEAQIYNITVSDSTSLTTGPLYLQHSQGQLKILNSTFISNKGFNCGILADFGLSGKLLYLENITIEGGTCTGNSIYLLSKVKNTEIELRGLNISGNKGVGLEISKVTITDSSSIYEKNELGVSLTDAAEVYFDSVKIIENKNDNTAGGVLIVSRSLFTCIECIISYNQGLEGAGLRSEQDSYFSILNSIFEGNRAMSTDSAIFILSSINLSTIENTQIFNNISEKDFVISVLNGNLSIKNSYIKENASLLGNPSIMSYASSITIYDTILSDQT